MWLMVVDVRKDLIFFFYLEKKILDLYIFFPFSARWSKLKLVAMVIFFIWNLFPNIGAFLFLI